MTGVKNNLLNVWGQASENLKKLSSCESPHDFVPEKRPGEVVVRLYRCRLCDGQVDRQAYDWYVLGLSHGRGKTGSFGHAGAQEKSARV